MAAVTHESIPPDTRQIDSPAGSSAASPASQSSRADSSLPPIRLLAPPVPICTYATVTASEHPSHLMTPSPTAPLDQPGSTLERLESCCVLRVDTVQSCAARSTNLP